MLPRYVPSLLAGGAESIWILWPLARQARLVACAQVPAGLTGYDASVAPALSDLEQWHVCLVNAEYQRSKKGKWRRLFPSERSSEYFQFFDPSRKLHKLPFGV